MHFYVQVRPNMNTECLRRRMVMTDVVAYARILQGTGVAAVFMKWCYVASLKQRVHRNVAFDYRYAGSRIAIQVLQHRRTSSYSIWKIYGVMLAYCLHCNLYVG